MDRKEYALSLRKNGYNCCQAVLSAFGEESGLPDETLRRMGAAFGGGMGNMNGPCGALCGAQMALGLLRYEGRPLHAAARRIQAAFVEKMNARAAELGMEDTVFQNCTGLPAEGHHTSAYDIALMSRELILRHPDIRTYSTIWMDALREGAFQLSNTNKLIRFYPGATGLKTGSTDSALYCLSATAEKEGMELIAVVLGSPTSADRFEGTRSAVMPVIDGQTQLLLSKEAAGQVTTTVSLPDSVPAPVEEGQTLGHLTVLVNGEKKGELPLVAQEGVEKLSLLQIYKGLLTTLFCGG